MSENVKIKINEYDKTSPGGRGIDSTDIAFVPGFSSSSTAPVLEPILCTTVKEFEELFGSSPRILTSTDVTDKYKKYGFLPNDPDRSYIFAKELLYQGMPVVYANLTQNSDTQFDLDSPLITEGRTSGLSVTADGNDLEIKYEGAETAPAINSDITIAVTTSAITIKKKSSEVLDYISSVDTSLEDKLTIKSIMIESVTSGASDVTFTSISDNQIRIENTTDNDFTVKLHFLIKLHININVNTEYSLTLQSSGSGSQLDAFYADEAKINNVLDMIADKSIYSVKYITSGGYPSIVKKVTESGTAPNITYSEDVTSAEGKFAARMLDAAWSRADAVALIDYQLAPEELPFNISREDAFYSKMQRVCSSLGHGEYGAAMYPWGQYDCGNAGVSGIAMPASYAYLMCLAKAIKSSPNWLAMAGVSRGVVAGIKKIYTPNNVLSNKDAEEMQPKFGSSGNTISINCITDVKPYGLTIWGNRTLLKVDGAGTVALNFLNTRNMLSDIKKLLYTTAKSLMFEQNSETLWLRFKAGVSPLLNQLKIGNGISDYKIIKATTRYDGTPLSKGEISAIIKIYPIHAVEYFELNVEILDDDVVVS